ncbi:hypothetical protein PG999_005400 [Apiospora kogelbergensis]|uniref:Uncharacterized protein n=1 Tax=Apiospora kogelbergensis TaxID=1337665 RepID=A0AAW0R250_9PEZI
MLLEVGLLLLAGSTLAATESKQCYFPHKNVHSLGIPCDPDAQGAVACCEATHTCLSNRLCWDTKTNHVLRGSCTDSAFKDPNCPHYCKGKAQGGDLGFLRQCNGRFDDWTCVDNLDVTNCALPFALAPGFVRDYRPSNVSNVIFSNANTTRGAHIEAPSPTSCDNKENATIQVGLGAGLGVGLPLVIALVLSLWFLRRARQELKQLRADHQPDSSKAADTEKYTQAPLQQPSDLPHQTSPAEMRGILSPQELESDEQVLRQAASSSAVQPPLSAVQTPARFYAAGD